MSEERRPLTAEEKEECAALKREFLAWNAPLPRKDRISQEKMAAHLKMNQGSFSNYLNGHRPVHIGIAVGVYELMGIPVDRYSPRLAAEIARLGKSGSPREDNQGKESNVIAADFSSKRKDLITIPRLDVGASMGHGLTRPDDYEDVIDNMRVSTGWLRRNVNSSSPDNLAVITGYGDSMEGTFSDGDLLLVDRGVTDIKIDAVYVLCLKDELYIKRLQRRPDGVLLMLSDNEKYKPYEIKNGELEQFEVLGRVLLAWNARKL